ncbi:hypothetical protein ACA910_000897 [Epithemia clementina (nom. ined.)]
MIGKKLFTTDKVRRRGIVVTLVLLHGSKILVLGDGSSGHSGVFHFSAERCFNSTHILEQSGRCVDGVSNFDHSVLKKCAHPGSSEETGYCHECSVSRLLCSASEQPHIACDENNLFPGNICGMTSYIVSWGCATQQHYFRTAQGCSRDGDQVEVDTHRQAMCGDRFPGFERCVVCPGTQLCVDADETCGSLGLSDGWSFSDVAFATRQPSPAPTTSTSGINETVVEEPTDNSLFLPIDSAESDFSCDSFQEDVSFYHEDCFNSTHTEIISGACLNGTLTFGSRAIATCENSGEGLSFCHKCSGKLVCTSSSNKDVVCSNALSDPFKCPITDDFDASLPMMSASFTGCKNSSAYFYNYEYCGSEDPHADSISTIFASQDALCGESVGLEEFGFCGSCRDGVQLCSTSGNLACGAHDYQDEISKLQPPIDCQLVSSDLDFYRERCFNATHTIIWSGRCISGALSGVAANINTCEQSGEGQIYCHECAHSHLLCSASADPTDACAADANSGDLEVHASSCDIGGDRTSSFGGCVDENTFFYSIASCANGDLSTNKAIDECGKVFGGFPFCASCDSFQICSTEAKTCSELGMHQAVLDVNAGEESSNDVNAGEESSNDVNAGEESSNDVNAGEESSNDVNAGEESSKGGGSQSNIVGSLDADFTGDDPAPITDDDGLDCGTVSVNMNYYFEECFNGTHVKLSQGECINGLKERQQTMLQSCADFGEDPGRQYCHQCADAVVCSNSDSSILVCEMTANVNSNDLQREGEQQGGNLPVVCGETISHLSGSYGCYDDEIFTTLFHSCHVGRFTAERNAFRCSDQFPGYEKCATCGKVSACRTESATCDNLGLVR